MQMIKKNKEVYEIVNQTFQGLIEYIQIIHFLS